MLDAGVPVLQGREAQLRTVLDHDLDHLVDQRGHALVAGVLEVDRRTGVVAEHGEHPGQVRTRGRHVHVHRDRHVQLDLGRHVNEHAAGPCCVTQRDGAVLVTAGPDLRGGRETTEVRLDERRVLDRRGAQVGHHDTRSRRSGMGLDGRQHAVDDRDLDATALDVAEHAGRGRRRRRGGRDLAFDVEAHVERGRAPELVDPTVGPRLIDEATRSDAAPLDEPRGLAGGHARGREGVRVQQGQRRHPTAPSISMAMSRLSSTEYSIGSSREIGSMKPRTIIAVASSSVMPRCCM